MPVPMPEVTVVRHRSALGSWEMARREPHPALKGHVQVYCGYWERTPGPMRRRELPLAQSVVIIDLGPPLRILDQAGLTAGVSHRRGFAAGLDDGFTLTETRGEMRGLEILFTPVGARLFFDRPMDTLARQVVSLEDVLGPVAGKLADALAEAPGWPARFDMLDELVLGRIEKARPLPPWVVEAWHRLESSGGLADIAGLFRDFGWSRKHVAASFREYIGMTPKRLARLIRFRTVLAALESGRYPDWASVALDCGYYDQAHFIREFHDLSGGTPSDYLRRRLPDGGGVRG